MKVGHSSMHGAGAVQRTWERQRLHATACLRCGRLHDCTSLRRVQPLVQVPQHAEDAGGGTRTASNHAKLTRVSSGGARARAQPPGSDGAVDHPDGEAPQRSPAQPLPNTQPNTQQGTAADVSEAEEGDSSLPVRMALAALAFYRNALSPLMQPSCRFQPTCSNYSILSYKRFGVWRGSVLTAWRLLRCNPWGNSGYDPPVWPPPGLAVLYGDGAWEYGPQVTVVLGAALLAWVANGLWQEVSHILVL